MRIGTWNLEGRWNGEHAEQRNNLLRDHACDIWLLTEVSPKAITSDKMLAGYHCHVSKSIMDDLNRKQHWAAVLSLKPLEPLPDPHPASAAAIVDGVTYCSSILPWRSARHVAPWVGEKHVEKTRAAIDELLEPLKSRTTRDLVWGGDWNVALDGKEVAGSIGGRNILIDALKNLGLVAVTTDLPHRIGQGYLTIDHVAIPSGWTLRKPAEPIKAEFDGKRLSDHDAYVVEVDPQ